MKVTLKTAPEGYEAEAEWRLPKQGEPIVRASGAVRFAAFDYNDHNHDFQIVLTPKKPKQWLLTEVATFEEATPFKDGRRFGFWSDGDLGAWSDIRYGGDVKQWLKVEVVK